MRANFSAEYFAFFTIFAQNPVACAELPHSCLPLDSSAFQPITPRFPSMQKRSPPHRGGCPKHRFMLDASGKPGLNYLCAGYQRYFRHLPPYLKAMVDLLAHGRPASDIMQAHLLVVNK